MYADGTVGRFDAVHALGKKYKVRRRGPAGAGQGRARDSRTDRLARTRTNNQFRVVVEESHSLGVLGPTGRGVSEHFGLEPRDIDILIASLSPASAAARTSAYQSCSQCLKLIVSLGFDSRAAAPCSSCR